MTTRILPPDQETAAVDWRVEIALLLTRAYQRFREHRIEGPAVALQPDQSVHGGL